VGRKLTPEKKMKVVNFMGALSLLLLKALPRVGRTELEYTGKTRNKSAAFFSSIRTKKN
jgi:hypothetical protein